MNRIKILLELAREELQVAELVLNNHYYRACISRIYYGIYHATQAVLESKQINPLTHRGLIQQFGQNFIKTGELSKELSIILKSAYDLRQLSDYDETVDFDLEQAQKLLTSAQYFIEQIEIYLSKSVFQNTDESS